MGTRENRERRRHKRYRVREGVYAVPEPHRAQMGIVMDISRGGLSYQYLLDTDAAESARTLSIISGRLGVEMHGLGFETVSDYMVSEPSPFSSVVMRRRGVRFTEVDTETEACLEQLIRDCALLGPEGPSAPA